MSNRRKLRVPGRYERPAGHRAPLGDHAGEAAIRHQYAFANAGRAYAAELATQATEPAEALATVESAGVLDRPAPALEVREATAVAIAEQPGDGPTGRLITVDVIKSGWNASGSRYYPAEVLERDVPQVYGKGTQVFIDHPRLSEQDDIPERSLTTLAGKFADTPWPVREADGSVTMRATVQVFGPWQPLIREAWDTIGLSINGGGRGEFGERDGREGTIIEALTFGRSVDFVTVPGAGGRVVALMESHRPFESPEFRASLNAVTTREAGSLGAFVESQIHLGFTQLGDDLYGTGRVTREERITLSGAIGDALGVFVARVEKDAPQLYQRGRYAEPMPDGGEAVTEAAAERRLLEASTERSRLALDQAITAAYGGDGYYSWVEDFDPAAGLVWFTSGHHEARSAAYQQSYVTNDGAVVLTGDRVEVRRTTVFVPVNAPGAVDGPPAAVAARVHADIGAYTEAARAATTETTAGGSPAANDGPNAPAVTTKESDMGEKTADVVAREAAETRATAAELELARYRAGDTAAPIVNQLLAEAADLPELAKTKIRAEYPAAALPLRESDRGLDEGTLRTRVAASITAERSYVTGLMEAAGAGTVRGAGPAAGAATGMPASFGGGVATQESAAPGGFFGFGGGVAAPVSPEQAAEDARTRESLVQIFMGRGATREAAEKAADEI